MATTGKGSVVNNYDYYQKCIRTVTAAQSSSMAPVNTEPSISQLSSVCNYQLAKDHLKGRMNMSNS